MGDIKPINRSTRKTFADFSQMINDGNIKGIMVAGFSSDGTVVSGWSEIDVCQQATLIGHLQVDLMNRFIKANYIIPE